MAIIDYNNEGTVCEPGNAECLITVGAYTSKKNWTDANGLPQSSPDLIVGDTCYFSSRGPTRDGRDKPDILAPGGMIASSVSDHFLQSPLNNYESTLLALGSSHYHDAGTSFASPHIAGLVALMFQVDPNLTYLEVLDCLQSTAIDGKVDGIEALRCVGADSYCQGECGDVNSDGDINISDAIWMIDYTFTGGPDPIPVRACGDANTDAATNVSDAVWIINYVFVGGPPPDDCSPGFWTNYGGNCCPFTP